MEWMTVSSELRIIVANFWSCYFYAYCYVFSFKFLHKIASIESDLLIKDLLTLPIKIMKPESQEQWSKRNTLSKGDFSQPNKFIKLFGLNFEKKKNYNLFLRNDCKSGLFGANFGNFWTNTIFKLLLTYNRSCMCEKTFILLLLGHSSTVWVWESHGFKAPKNSQ